MPKRKITLSFVGEEKDTNEIIKLFFQLHELVKKAYPDILTIVGDESRNKDAQA
jgi:hypothetical protein